MKRIENIGSVSKVNWLNLLPDLQQKKVLKIGTESIDMIKAIFYSNVASLSCVGDSQDEIKHIVKNFYHKKRSIKEKFDVVIFDEVETGITINALSDVICKTKELLNKTGVLLVRCPDGWRNVKYRYIIKRALLLESKGSLKYFICSPSSAKPYLIMPYINDKTWLTYTYPNIEENTYNTKVIIKEKIKGYIFRVLGKYNPISGLVITFDNSCALENGRNKNEKNTLVEICVSYHYSNKHYLFSYDLVDKKLNRMRKIEFNPSEYGNNLEREYNNLLLFKEFIEIYGKNKIVIPRAVYFNKLPDRHESSMTVVEGVSLKYLVDKNMHQNNTENVIDFLNRATNMMICFQRLTDKYLKEAVYEMDSDYFLNYLELDLRGVYIEGGCIQHCDFAANNIHLDCDADRWGIIDWEGLSQGMPPMLDLFSMFTSFRFTVDNKEYISFQENYYDAIVDTYFSDNWISRCVLKNLEKYCYATKVSEKNIYCNFILFLLFQANKFRIFKVYEYQHLFERILKFAINNKDKFIAMSLVGK